MGYVTNNSIERRTPLKSKTAIRRTQMKRVPGTARMERKPINKVGPRTKKWRTAWRFLKPELEKRGRTGCEFGFIPHDCGGPLDPAHSKKRGKVKGKDIYAVAMCCRQFHDRMEVMPHEQMESLVMKAINLAGGLIIPEKRAA